MCPFPVGYVYLSSNNTSPASTYGGNWSTLNESRYLRLAGAWGTGGSNTISVDQMPSHTHSMEARVASNHNPGGTVFQGSATDANWFPSAAVRMTATGGGQHSIQATEMCTLGTEQPNSEEGGKLCVTFKTLGSKLALLTKRFVHSQLAISICQVTRQAQQALTEVRGHLSQILGFCGQAVRGIQQAAKVRILLLHKKCHHILTVFGIVLVNRQLPKKLSLLSQVGLDRVGADIIWMPLATMLHTITSRLTAPAIVGIAPLKAGEC